MKSELHCFIKAALATVILSSATIASLAAQEKPMAAKTNAAPYKLETGKSVFVMPTKREEGRDPFYPLSTAPYERNRTVAPPTTPKAPIPTLDGAFELQSISQAGNRRFVIINGKTFAEGESDEVTTPRGRVRITCIQVKPETSSAIIEVSGERKELRNKSLQ